MRYAPAVLLALVACAPMADGPDTPARPAPPPADLTACEGTQYQRLLGQPATALERELILRQVRVIRPGDAVTMDFRPDRLNFEVGADGTITDIRCG